jgi:flagellar protein FliS
VIWKEAYLANVVSADPLELVCLLYQHALDSVRNARRHLASGDIAERGSSISRVVAIIGELNSSLNHNAGGDISKNLEGLYEYMSLRLTEANIRKQDAPLAEVESLLTTLCEAWQEMKTRDAAAPAPAVTAPAWKQESDLEAVGHGWSA